MTLYKRVAIFFAPESQSSLAKFGASWLGWDVENACEVAHPEIDGLPTPVPELVSTPKKYGFHGTLKAPFRLNDNRTLDELRMALNQFSSQTPRFKIGQMQVARLRNFVAVIQEKQSEVLADFASDVVKSFEDYRAPMSDDDIVKRRKAGLTTRQDELMLKWGYPFIFEEFRFHLTLTGKLSKASAEKVQDVLSECLADILSEPLEVVDLCLYGEREDGRFEIIERFPLLG